MADEGRRGAEGGHTGVSACPGGVVVAGGWQLPTGRTVAGGTHLLAVVPAVGAIVTVDGKTWVTQWPAGYGRLLPMPGWVAETFGGNRLEAAA